MARKGYNGELKVKHILEEKYGKGNVIKAAIGQAMDYIILQDGRVAEFVEVKETHSKYVWKPKPREIDQFRRIHELQLRHQCRAWVWIIKPREEPKVLPLVSFLDIPFRDPSGIYKPFDKTGKVYDIWFDRGHFNGEIHLDNGEKIITRLT